MIYIENDHTTLHITRGDATHTEYNCLAIQFPIYNVTTEETELYEFKVGDKLRLTVFEKNGYTKNEILVKEYTIDEATTTPVLSLTSTDTKKFELTNKKKTYWYDVVLNDDTTIIGVDINGAKEFIVYPEASEE